MRNVRGPEALASGPFPAAPAGDDLRTVACYACWFPAANGVVVQPHAGMFALRLAPDVKGAASEMLRHGIPLCVRCYGHVRTGHEAVLRESIMNEFEASHDVDPRLRPGRLLQAELAITLTSWTCRPFEYPVVSPGFAFLNAVWVAFPRAWFNDDRPPASLLERDLGNGVVGVFTVVAGSFVIENFASRWRGHHYGRRALRTLCALADRHQTAMLGAVEPNAYGGWPIGLTTEQLLAWYATEQFAEVSHDGVAALVYRAPQIRKS